MKNSLLIILMFFGMLPVCIAEQAPIKPRKQKASEVKQEIAEAIGDILKLGAETIQDTAQIQKKLVDEIIQLADGSDDSFFSKAKVEQLALHRDVLLKIRDSYTCIRKQQEKEMHNLVQSVVIK